MTEAQIQLNELIVNTHIADGSTLQSALRDILTDLRHVAETIDLDFDLAIEGSEEVYHEEMED